MNSDLNVVSTDMSTQKKTKLQKQIKAVDKKKAVLSLCCEWLDCMYNDSSVDSLTEHVRQHVDEILLHCPPTFTPDAQFSCHWRDCEHDVSFATVSDLLRHMFFHVFHAKLKSIGATLIELNSLSSCQLESSNRNMIPDLPEKLTCCWKRCQEGFDNPELYYSHVAQHADCYPPGNKPDGGCLCVWDGCHVVVKSKHRLKEHLRCHTQEKMLACPTCGSLFANATKLFDHIQRQADANANHYECSHCNKRCATERLLRDHMRLHVNHYRCPFCEKTCPNPSSLRTHVHYRHTEDRPYRCPTCDHWSKSAVDLRRHIEKHSESWMTCEVDGCTFHSKHYWEMNLHCRNTHEGAHPAKYLCHVCSRKYRYGRHLTKHLHKVHQFKWPSGHTRFRYKQHDDGFYRLLTVTYECVNMKEQIISMKSDLSPGIDPPLDLSSAVNPWHITETATDLVDVPHDTASVPSDVDHTGVVYLSNLELLGNVAVAMPRTAENSCDSQLSGANRVQDFVPLHGPAPGVINCDGGMYELQTVVDDGSWKHDSVDSPAYYITLPDAECMDEQAEGLSQVQLTGTWHSPAQQMSQVMDMHDGTTQMEVSSENHWTPSEIRIQYSDEPGVGTILSATLPTHGSFDLTLTFDPNGLSNSRLVFDPSLGTFVVDSNDNFDEKSNNENADVAVDRNLAVNGS